MIFVTVPFQQSYSRALRELFVLHIVDQFFRAPVFVKIIIHFVDAQSLTLKLNYHLRLTKKEMSIKLNLVNQGCLIFEKNRS